MKKIVMILFSSVFLFLINCSDSGQTAAKPQPDPVQSNEQKLNAFLGEMREIINGAERVESYQVKMKQVNATQNTIAGYPIVKKGTNLNVEQVALLKKVLLSADTYDFERVKKNFLLPEYAFVIKKGNQSVTVLIDYYRNEILFRYGTTEKKEDFDNARESMMKITQALFPR